jgi:hypothetical protein
VSVDADTLLDNLDMALMLAGEARKGRWLIATDIIYLDFSKADSAVRSIDFNPGPGPINISTTGLNAGTQSSLKGWLWTLAGGYAAIQGAPTGNSRRRSPGRPARRPSRVPAAWRSPKTSGRASWARRGAPCSGRPTGS